MHKSYHVDYFQAIFQIRPKDNELIKFLEKQVEKNHKVWISKKVNLKTGVDYYISSNKFARQIGKKMKESFPGELKESVKLFSRDKLRSKDMYRVTVCFRRKAL